MKKASPRPNYPPLEPLTQSDPPAAHAPAEDFEWEDECELEPEEDQLWDLEELDEEPLPEYGDFWFDNDNDD